MRGSAGRERLPPPQGVEDRVARVLFGPDRRQAARIVQRRPGRRRADLAEEIALPGLLVGRPRHAAVVVGAADEAVLERVDPVLGRDLQPGLERVADDVGGGRAGWRRGLGVGRRLVRVARLEHLLEVALLVGGEQARRALRVALHLVDFNQRLEPRAPLEDFGRERRTVGVVGRQHDAPAVVGVVRNGDHVAVAGARRLHPFPEPLRRMPPRDGRAAPGRNLRPAEEDVAVQPTPAGAVHAAELEGGERGEHARLVVGVGHLFHQRPLVRRAPVAAVVGTRLRAPAQLGVALAPERIAALPEECLAAAGPELPADRQVVGGRLRILAELHLAQPVVVVGHRHEVQWRGELAADIPIRIEDRFAPAVAVRHRGIVVHRVAEHPRVERPAAMHVQVAEVGVPERVALRTRACGRGIRRSGRLFVLRARRLRCRPDAGGRLQQQQADGRCRRLVRNAGQARAAGESQLCPRHDDAAHANRIQPRSAAGTRTIRGSRSYTRGRTASTGGRESRASAARRTAPARP